MIGELGSTLGAHVSLVGGASLLQFCPAWLTIQRSYTVGCEADRILSRARFSSEVDPSPIIILSVVAQLP
jgi:hypothetical protein